MMDRFTTFRSTFEALKAFPAEEMKMAYIMMGEYALDGILPEAECSAAYGLFLSIKPLIDASIKKSEAGKAGGSSKQTEADSKQTAANRKQIEADCKQTASKPKQTASTTEAEGKLKKKEESIKDKKETLSNESVKKKFTPPTTEEVRQYAGEIGVTIDADRFVDFYASKGWMVGKTKMSDWKAAVRNWGRSQRQELTANGMRQESTAKKNAFTNFPQRNYDFDALEKQLLAAQMQG